MRGADPCHGFTAGAEVRPAGGIAVIPLAGMRPSELEVGIVSAFLGAPLPALLAREAAL
ncbi:hypothetical protein [Streptomyces sp. ISL-100]|uniref:hypothetical protein n=1 Tax=Streptomyces sp. ISL-100 TaxID=2819173 RepID=UPI001BEC561A|nr:hypothetical protein [Streptomyces sp. ISL-100]MBT2401790.1 hypothetical protein [Streptomyces sp. ISL-100]